MVGQDGCPSPVPVDLQVRGLRRDVTPDGALVFSGFHGISGINIQQGEQRGTRVLTVNCVFNPTPKGESSTFIQKSLKCVVYLQFWSASSVCCLLGMLYANE